MNKSKIEWTDDTWNPVMGCTPASPGCAHCYARTMMKRYAGLKGWPESPDTVTLFPERLEKPMHWRKPRKVFVCSMSDLFHDDVPDRFIQNVFETMRKAAGHTFQILTKRPERMKESVGNYIYHRSVWKISNKPLPNVWLGVTAENQEMWERRKDALFATPAVVHFVSYEPALGPLVFSGDDLKRLDWVICGGETGPGARPMKYLWVASLRDQCQSAGVPFFFKGPGTAHYSRYGPGYRQLDGREWNEFPCKAAREHSTGYANPRTTD